MTGAAQMLTVRVPLAVRKPRGGRKLVLMPGGMAPGGSSAADTTLVKALARAFRWRRMMETGRFATINELAAAEKINSSYVSRLLRLTLLAPDIVDAILDGRQPAGMTLPALMEPFPIIWPEQRLIMGKDEFEGLVVAQAVGVVGVLVSGGDHQHPEPQDVSHAVDDTLWPASA